MVDFIASSGQMMKIKERVKGVAFRSLVPRNYQEVIRKTTKRNEEDQISILYQHCQLVKTSVLRK